MFRRRSSSQNYYSNRGSEPRGRRALSNKLHAIKNFVIRVSVVFLIGGIIYEIFFTPILAVKNVIVEGNKVVNIDEIREMIISRANQKIFKIINNNLLLIDPAGMESAVLNRFGNINAVKIEKKFPQTIRVVIREKPADISWCNKIKIEKVISDKNVPSDEVLSYEIPQCYLSDEEGIIYEKIGDSIRVFRDEPIEMGIKIGDENLKNFIRKISYDFNNKTGLNLAYLYILPLAERELHLITNENLKIYFDLNRGADEQISDLSAFIKDELKKNGNKSMNYEYIDLRIVDRINVKPKNEVKQ